MKMNKRASLFLLIVFFCTNANIYAQEGEAEQPEEKHLVTIALGYSYIPKGGEEGETEANGVVVPSLGVDYLYRLNPKWEIGLMADVELGNYIVIHKELNRENAFIIAGIGAYKLSDHWTFFGGGGIELEKHEHLAILRLGTDYNFSLGKGWIIAPVFSYDIKEGYDTWSLALAVGKGF